MTSQVLQRWTASWITFTLLWLLKWIIAWLSHPAQYLEIALFILPLLMIIIICSGYSEANGEAAKIIWVGRNPPPRRAVSDVAILYTQG